jgi:hypothetical protein
MPTIVVGVAILVAALIWSPIDDTVMSGASADEPGSTREGSFQPVAGGIDVAAIQALLDGSGGEAVVASADGATVRLTGEVVDEPGRNAVIDAVSIQPGVLEVDGDGLIVEGAP